MVGLWVRLEGERWEGSSYVVALVVHFYTIVGGLVGRSVGGW